MTLQMFDIVLAISLILHFYEVCQDLIASKDKVGLFFPPKGVRGLDKATTVTYYP